MLNCKVLISHCRKYNKAGGANVSIAKVLSVAKQTGKLKIVGTIGDVVYYKTDQGYYAQSRRDVGSRRWLTSKAYKGFRDNLSDFGVFVDASCLLKRTLEKALHLYPFSYIRLNSLFLTLRSFCPAIPPGQRSVGEALISVEGREHLRGFNFNYRSVLQHCWDKPLDLLEDGSLLINKFQTGRDLIFPPEADYVEITVFRLHLDFEAGRSMIIPYVTIKRRPYGKARNLLLKPLKKELGPGNVLYFLQVRFFGKLEKGGEKALNGRRNDVLYLLAVDPPPGKIDIRKLSPKEIKELGKEPRRRAPRSTLEELRDPDTGRIYTQEELEKFMKDGSETED